MNIFVVSKFKKQTIMKKLLISIVVIMSLNCNVFGQKIAPYIKVGETTETMQQTYDRVIAVLKDNSFSVLGAYNPSEKKSLKVIAFTRTDLKNTVVKVADRGALAAVFKVGLVQENSNVTISYTNPDYILRAYLGANYYKNKVFYQKFSAALKAAFASLGTDLTPFGGVVKESKLKKYHYMAMMPYFTDPVILKEFSSFEEGLKKIQENLVARKGNTTQVYKLIYKSKKVAVFGIGLKSKKDGEAHFLPIIGESHVAAMPYEIILQDNKASMLHGKYRIALHWPELTMGTFMKIMSTPGNIKDTLEKLCE